jgi:putative phosphoesterase
MKCSDKNAMQKIFILTDTHANLPALEAVLTEIRQEGYDAIYHLGDAVAIGPFPNECLALLLRTPQIRYVMGNHDAWLVHGVPQPQPVWMSEGEAQHQRWTHEQIDKSFKQAVANWPYQLEEVREGVHLWFGHYALDKSGRDFLPFKWEPTVNQLDMMFVGVQADLLFFGHSHQFCDQKSRLRYVNPGALGCYHEPVARYTAVTLHNNTFTLEHRQVSYSKWTVYHAFESRDVPERHFLYKAFFGNQFQQI